MLFLQKEKGSLPCAEDALLCIENVGIAGDCHADGSARQISVLPHTAAEQIEEMKTGRPCLEKMKVNLIIRDAGQLSENDYLQFDEAVLRITKKGRTCHGICDLAKRGTCCPLVGNLMFAEVIKGGTLRVKERGILL